MTGNGNSGYTHREWRVEMYDLTVEGLTKMLGGALKHMHADLVSVGASQGQLEFSSTCQTLIEELASRGARILGDWQPKAQVMGDALAQAGGMEARDKEYHQT